MSDFSDPEGKETLDVIGKANRFNLWMYSVIQRYCRGRILEIGSGIGNISQYFLQDRARLHLSDIRPEYCEILKAKFGNIPNLLGVDTIDLVDADFERKYAGYAGNFDSVFALNVIEHIEDEHQALENARYLLGQDGKLIILVPSYSFLYCRFDKELGHYRRYTRKKLVKSLQDAGFSIDNSFYFNAAGIAGWFLFGKLMGRAQIESGEMGLYNKLVPLFKLVDKITFRTFGLSVIAVATKK